SGDFPTKYAIGKGISFTDTTKWHNVAVTYNVGMVKAYLDGAEAMAIDLLNEGNKDGHYLFLQYDAGLNVPVLGAASGWNRGASAIMPWNGDVGAKQFYYGMMDEFRLYNTALDQTEITALANTCVTSNVITNREETLKVYPNPTRGNVVYFPAHINGHVAIYSLSGNTVINQAIHGASLDVTSLKPGIYIVEVSYHQKVSRTKLIVE
ncbi:MAG: T9SS type A sorting domain-containing protein, partial [Bacteroidales bacterium]|nr:T9SS type A sorting domain-containing protein [Bacteroidales bacterium]